MRRTLFAALTALAVLSWPARAGAQAQTSAAAPPSSSSVSIPPSAPNGAISMIKPGQSGDASYYKIAQGQKISFAWNYSDVIITPSTLLISAVCTVNAVTYDLGGVDGHATEFVFDPFEYNQNAPKSQLPPLMQASYKLMITNPDATASAPGVAAGNSKVTFAMYNPQAYTPLSEWTCAQCSGASRFLPTRPLVMGTVVSLLAMVLGGCSVLSRSLNI